MQEFLAQGVHLKTPAADELRARPLPRRHPAVAGDAVDYTWFGTTFAPGVKHYIDIDADGKIDGELRGEQVYGGQDVWLNLDAQDFPGSALADNFFATHAPCTGNTAAPGVTDPCGSSGSAKSRHPRQLGEAAAGGHRQGPVLVDGGYAPPAASATAC